MRGEEIRVQALWIAIQSMGQVNTASTSSGVIIRKAMAFEQYITTGKSNERS